MPAVERAPCDPASSCTSSRRLADCDITEIDGIPVMTPELLDPAARVVEAASRTTSRPSSTRLRRKRHDHVRTRRTRPSSGTPDVGSRASSATRDRARALGPGQRADRQRDGDDAAPNACAPTACPNRCCSSRCSTRTACSSLDADAGLPQWRVTIEYQSMQEHLDEFQVAAGRSSPQPRHGGRILAARRAPRRPEVRRTRARRRDPGRSRAATSATGVSWRRMRPRCSRQFGSWQ